MATVLLSAAGAALGGSVGGSILGLSMAAVGRFAGAVIGRSIDQRLMGQGSDTVETGRVNRLRLTGTGEGDAIAQVYGRMRVAGQVIWATEFLETSTTSGGGGKGAPSGPKVTQYSYSLSLAVALCEGEISTVGRIWADGIEISPDDLTLRVYTGSRDQLPDPKIEAVEGAGTVPAYRGTAYVVIEDLDLSPYGNRVPQFTFEVSRPVPADQPGAEIAPTYAVRGTALLPGSGEYALATTTANINYGPGSQQPANVNSPSGKTDFLTSLGQMTGELKGLKSTSLIVSWFGDDLRCGQCTIRPKVEQAQYDAGNMPWQVGPLTRQTAQLVPTDDEDRQVYGGTPTDQAVIEAIQALNNAGTDVMYYPFILMDQMPGNGLPDPYSEAEDQPVLPWRGRITTSLAPNRDGSPDGTAAAEAEVAAFFGTATAADFLTDPDPEEGAFTGWVAGSEGSIPKGPQVVETPAELVEYSGTRIVTPITYSGPDEWSYRRFILHQAALCAAAGGVESFCIGSEMRGLTQIRGADNSFPAVEALIDLAAEVRLLLGPYVMISYAADWSEYFGYQPQDGTGDRYFHLDPLWADPNIDFIGIDNYMPLSDWRDGPDHLDAQAHKTIYDLDYLRSNIEGGEGYDWFYSSANARDAQVRTPITDDAHNEPWIWRYKDIRNWWQNAHFERIGGVRQPDATAWEPRSKPVRFTEYGCAAVDKGTNQPNKFLDPKSSESTLPHYSDGRRDELIQQQYLRAFLSYWNDPANNPQSDVYDGAMLEMDHAYAWAWDMRPYPYFPNNRELWSDGENYTRGHWLNGRISSRTLASVIDEICLRAGLDACDTSRAHGLVRGYTVDQVSEARSALQPLMLRYGFDAVERGGRLQFIMRDGGTDRVIDLDTLVRDPEMDGVIEETRGSTVELAGRVRLRFVEADGDFEVIAEEAILPDNATHAVSTSEFPLAMTRAEGRQTVERWLSEARVATDTLRLTLPPSQLETGAGDVIAIPEGQGRGLFRIDRADQMAGAQKLEAVRIEPESYRPAEFEDEAVTLRPFVPPSPVAPFFLDLPLLTGDEVPHAPHFAVTARPWPGSVALYASDEDSNYALNTLVTARTPVGVLETPLLPAHPGRIDRGPDLQVRMLGGTLESISDLALLNGGNLCAIGDGTPDGWELIQFRDADLVDTDTYLLGNRLRGQVGTERTDPWPEGSYLVRLDGTAKQIDLTEAKRGLARYYRIGPAGRPVDDPSFSAVRLAFDGLGLRPLSPVHLRLAAGAGGDLSLSWIRRTRIDGDRWDTADVPLGEDREEYLVRVVQQNAVIRQVTTTAPVWTYSAANQAADALSGLYEIQVAQVSTRFGPGRFARIEVPA
ncbi:phage host specificity protein [Roseovarius atlanticus]|uniref:Phage host specificity protein n=1 Tax=Roseovarius atlanticus TaxID=1641875 RepID=A0A0T5NSX4_9RHOB|nr:glycoside hydrolase TIM-barrel-like domain-containing protein [Roseovarius atlanticus]KRS12035.1 phage host specificity protein [Roseovarius atlanticus]